MSDICREYGISEPTFYNWKSQNGGISLSELQSINDSEAENARLKRQVADLALDSQILKEVNLKKW